VTLRLQLSQVLLCILGDTRCIADSIAAQKEIEMHIPIYKAGRYPCVFWHIMSWTCCFFFFATCSYVLMSCFRHMTSYNLFRSQLRSIFGTSEWTELNDPEVDRERKLLPTNAAHAIYVSMILPMHKSGTKASQFWMLYAVCCGHFPKTGHFIAGKSQWKVWLSTQ
jgi:hypothetical protein